MIKLLAMLVAVTGFAMAEGCENGTAGEDGKCASCNEGFDLHEGACVEAAKTDTAADSSDTTIDFVGQRP